MRHERPHIVIVGGGFGGLYAARALRRAPARITLIDRRNHHLFLPLLYQVATAGLNPGDIARPIRRILRRQANTEVILGEAAAMDVAARRVVLTDAVVSYDYLILAAGSRVSYFGHDEWAACAPGLGDIDDALEIRRRVLLAYEAAEREPDAGRRRELLSFVVVGGGPTGVELAGAIGEMARLAMVRDFRHIDPASTRIVLVEGGERILPQFPPTLAARARSALEKLGVEVRTGCHVTSVDEEGAMVGEERIVARTVLWAAGTGGSDLGRSLGARTTRSGRVIVEPDLSLPGHPEVFVVGDLAAVDQGDGLVPPLAPAAIQEGRHAARNILRAMRGERSLPFRYVDKGTLATVGRAAGVADLGRLKLWGFPAWVAWLFVHIFFLIGFRNRFVVLFQWAWAYLTYERGARLVTGGTADLRRRPPDGDRS